MQLRRIHSRSPPRAPMATSTRSSSSAAPTRAPTAVPAPGSRSAPTPLRPTRPRGTSMRTGTGRFAPWSRTRRNNTGSDIVNVTIDRTAPADGSVTYADGYDVDGSVAIATDAGTDSGSGIDLASLTLERDAIALAAGSCGVFTGSWTSVSAPDTTVASGNCYRYRYRVADNAGNVTTYTSLNVVKVDTSTPVTTDDAAGRVELGSGARHTRSDGRRRLRPRFDGVRRRWRRDADRNLRQRRSPGQRLERRRAHDLLPVDGRSGERRGLAHRDRSHRRGAPSASPRRSRATTCAAPSTLSATATDPAPGSPPQLPVLAPRAAAPGRRSPPTRRAFAAAGTPPDCRTELYDLRF